MGKTRKKSLAAVFAALLLASVLALALIWAMPARKASALEKPGEFGNKVGNAFDCTYDGKNASVQNYERGYVVYKRGSNPDNRDDLFLVLTGKNVALEGDALKATNVSADTMKVHAANNLNGVDKWYGEGYPGNEAMKKKFADAYVKYYNNGLSDGKTYQTGDFNIGIAIGDLDVWDNIVAKQDYWYGGLEGRTVNGRVNNAILMYSKVMDDIFVSYGTYYNKWDENKALLKQPVTNPELLSGAKAIDGVPADVVVQVFENGYIKAAGDVVFGVYDKNTNTFTPQKVLPDLVLSKDYGAKVGNPVEVGGYTYQNLTNGYAKYRLNAAETAYEISYRANFNFEVKDGKVSNKPVSRDVYAAEARKKEVATTGGDDIQQVVGPIDDTVKAKIKENFLNALYDAVEEQNWGIGLCISVIKHWNGVVLQDWAKGDGGFSFGGDRHSMSMLVLNPEDLNVYLVGMYAAVWAPDNGGFKNSMQAPVSNVLPEKKVNFNGREVTFRNLQIFQKGFIYTSEEDKVVTMLGYTYDSESNTFLPAPAPVFTGQSYGNQVGSTIANEAGTVFYINYERGCVKAERRADGFKYTMYNGRRFNAEKDYAVELLPMETFVTLDGLKKYDFKAPTGFTKDEMAQLIYDTYKKWYDKGYLLGQLMGSTGAIGSWNDVFAAQFKCGDSSADPFGDGRPNVAALMLGTAEGHKDLYLVEGDTMMVFNKSYEHMRAPLEDPVEKTDLGITVQRFTIRSGLDNMQGYNFVVSKAGVSYLVYSRDQTYESFLAGYEKGSASHAKDPSKGYIGQGDVYVSALNLPEDVTKPFAAAATAAAAAGVAGAGVIGLLRKKDHGFRKLYRG